MHMTIREYTIAPGQADEILRRVDDDWLERLHKMPGFVSYHVVRPAEFEMRHGRECQSGLFEVPVI